MRLRNAIAVITLQAGERRGRAIPIARTGVARYAPLALWAAQENKQFVFAKKEPKNS